MRRHRLLPILALLGAGCLDRTKDTDETGPVDTGDTATPPPGGPAITYGLYNGFNLQSTFTGDLDAFLAEVEAERVPRMEDLGMGMSRIHERDGWASFAWPVLDPERDGVDLDLSVPDALVAAACANGIQLMPTIGPASVADVDAMDYPGDADAYAVYVETLVERYDGDEDFGPGPAPEAATQEAIVTCPVRHWMVGNELDLTSKWNPGWCMPAQYADVLVATYDIAHAADPEATVLYGGLSWNASYDEPSWTFFDGLVEKLDTAFAGQDAFDVMAVHVYPNTLALHDVTVFFDAVQERLGRPLPLWVTEAGFSAVFTGKMDDENASELTQARGFLALQMLTYARAGLGTLLIDVVDPGDNSPMFEGFGLQSPEAVPRLAWYGFRKMVELLVDLEPGTVTVEMEDDDGRFAWRGSRTGGGEILLLVFDPASLSSYRPGGTLSDETRTFTVSGITGSTARAIDALPPEDAGAEVGASPTFAEEALSMTGGTLTIEVGPRPVWVVVDP